MCVLGQDSGQSSWFTCFFAPWRRTTLVGYNVGSKRPIRWSFSICNSVVFPVLSIPLQVETKAGGRRENAHGVSIPTKGGSQHKATHQEQKLLGRLLHAFDLGCRGLPRLLLASTLLLSVGLNRLGSGKVGSFRRFLLHLGDL